MTLKSWKSEYKRKDSKIRRISSRILKSPIFWERFAIVISVFSLTVSASGVAFTAYQAKLTRDQLTSADRNRAFVELIEEIDKTCIDFWKIWLPASYKVINARGVVNDKTLNGWVDETRNSMVSRWESLRPKYRSFTIWAREEEFHDAQALRFNLVNRLRMMIFDKSNFSVEERRKFVRLIGSGLNSLTGICEAESKAVTDWFRTGNPLVLQSGIYKDLDIILDNINFSNESDGDH